MPKGSFPDRLVVTSAIGSQCHYSSMRRLRAFTLRPEVVLLLFFMLRLVRSLLTAFFAADLLALDWMRRTEDVRHPRGLPCPLMRVPFTTDPFIDLEQGRLALPLLSFLQKGLMYLQGMLDIVHVSVKKNQSSTIQTSSLSLGTRGRLGSAKVGRLLRAVHGLLARLHARAGTLDELIPLRLARASRTFLRHGWSEVVVDICNIFFFSSNLVEV